MEETQEYLFLNIFFDSSKWDVAFSYIFIYVFLQNNASLIYPKLIFKNKLNSFTEIELNLPIYQSSIG